MNEITRFSPNIESEKKFKSIERVFETKLGLKFPETPSDLPDNISLNHNVYGGLLEAVQSQVLVDPYEEEGEPRERSQFVGILGRKGKPFNSKVYVGTSLRTGDGLAELSRWFWPIVGRKIKPLVYWHTHTYKADSQTVTESDVAQRLGEDRKGLIYLHASATQITAIFQTKDSYPKRIPTSTANKGFKAYDELVEFYGGDVDEESMVRLADFLEKKGYALYMWDKPRGVESIFQGINSGCFIDGIELKKIKNDYD